MAVKRPHQVLYAGRWMDDSSRIAHASTKNGPQIFIGDEGEYAERPNSIQTETENPEPRAAVVDSQDHGSYTLTIQ
ncbi:uncharacterized protein TRIVIDRAFT_215090 [Trichoderma virens Gv29-8]|uniref:Uncharacterized protein n=1 Tax=Hypocrea virens (strain Gv29-8 / FGSC 10586) TaxID=413071 RepID=G9MDW0_HYPVG|nr:uncharacterized protein TRIVIDRAFT_215090 [Trichoderma virens Gv29-8]EHK27257.1 hypothetical protein TRIVIDRAFT_215090 [Trichoderma virens Gv29-8]